MRWKRLLWIAPVVLAGFLTLTGFAAHRCGHDPERMRSRVTARVEDALDDLEATPEQRTRVLALADRMLQDGAAAREGHHEAVKALAGQWDQAAPDAAAVHALVDARVDALRKLAHEAADAGLQLHATLTPEQRAKVARKVARFTGDR
jgi:Spy/CpxP family protein refolding chaperone